METLKYAILGLLMKKDMTGYELTKEFNSALFEFWNASHSQIYPKLKALTKEGLIEYHIEITGTVLEKKVYTITDAGKEAFKKWEETLYPMPSLPKDEFRLQLFFSHLASPEFRIQLLQDQLSQHLDRLDYLKEDMEKFAKVYYTADQMLMHMRIKNKEDYNHPKYSAEFLEEKEDDYYKEIRKANHDYYSDLYANDSSAQWD